MSSNEEKMLMALSNLEKNVDLCRLQRDLLLTISEIVCRRTPGPAQDAAIKDLRAAVERVQSQLIPDLKLVKDE